MKSVLDLHAAAFWKTAQDHIYVVNVNANTKDYKCSIKKTGIIDMVEQQVTYV